MLEWVFIFAMIGASDKWPMLRWAGYVFMGASAIIELPSRMVSPFLAVLSTMWILVGLFAVLKFVSAWQTRKAERLWKATR